MQDHLCSLITSPHSLAKCAPAIRKAAWNEPSATLTVRILDGSFEIARHARTYDRHQLVLDPAHQDAVLKIKRKAFHSTPGGRLEQAAPESKPLLDLAFAHGESAGAVKPCDPASNL